MKTPLIIAILIAFVSPSLFSQEEPPPFLNVGSSYSIAFIGSDRYLDYVILKRIEGGWFYAKSVSSTEIAYEWINIDNAIKIAPALNEKK